MYSLCIRCQLIHSPRNLKQPNNANVPAREHPVENAQPGPVLLVVQPGDGGPVEHPTENDVYVCVCAVHVFSSVRR